MAFIKGNLFIDAEDGVIEDEAEGHIITGGATSSTTRFKYGVASVYFNGISDYLTTPHDIDWNFGSGDFTIDMWIRPNFIDAGVNNTGIINKWVATTGNRSWILNIRPLGGISFIARGPSDTNFINVTDESPLLVIDTWTHIAVTRENEITRLFVNGTLVGTDPSVGSIADTSTNIAIGTLWEDSGEIPNTNTSFDGFIDNIRVVKGTALWTEDFAVSEEDLNYSNTGDLFIDGEGVIEDENGTHTITNSGASVSTAEKVIGTSSIYFDGNSELTIPEHTDFEYGSGQFTIDFWVKGIDSDFLIFNNVIEVKDKGDKIQVMLDDNRLEAILDMDDGFWHHIAIVREGTGVDETKLYIDGIVGGTVQATDNFGSVGITDIGHNRFGNYSTCYMDQIRSIKGTALWTTSFNLTDESLFYIVDVTNPDITITSPTTSPTYYISGSTINVEGVASDDEALSEIRWENTTTSTSGTATGLETWSEAGIALNTGLNNIIMTAVDASNNINTDEINVTRDETNPVVTILNPTDDPHYRTASTLVTLVGTATDAVPIVSVTWDDFKGGSGSATGTENWSIADIPLIEGTNTIQVNATDAAGNFYYDTIQIEQDPLMNKVSGIYNIVNKDRGKASEGFIRPTLKQLFTSTDFEEIPNTSELIGYTEDLCTDNPENSFCSDYVNASWMAYKAFDNGDNTYTGWHTGYTTPYPHWIVYDFGEANKKQIEKITMMGGSRNTDEADQSPKDFLIQGSDNSTDWALIKEYSSQIFAVEEVKTYTFTNDQVYRYYRIWITNNNYSSTRVMIDEMEMMEGIYE